MDELTALEGAADLAREQYDFSKIPLVSLPGSEQWESAQEWSETMELIFPDQDVDHF